MFLDPSGGRTCARQIASSSDSAARASERAAIKMPAPSSRASTATRTLLEGEAERVTWGSRGSQRGDRGLRKSSRYGSTRG
jgi:hypothetical protein